MDVRAVRGMIPCDAGLAWEIKSRLASIFGTVLNGDPLLAKQIVNNNRRTIDRSTQHSKSRPDANSSRRNKQIERIFIFTASSNPR